MTLGAGSLKNDAYLSGTVLQGVESSNKMNMEAFFGFQIIKLLITCN